jgi:hypothetical protein
MRYKTHTTSLVRWLLATSMAANLVLFQLLLRTRAQRDAGEARNADYLARVRLEHTARLEAFHDSATHPNSIVFLGDSITAEGEWGELFGPFVNRGMPGDTTTNVIARLNEVTERRPACLSLMIGVNDLLQGRSPDELVASYTELTAKLRQATPHTLVSIVSILPVRDAFSRVAPNEVIREVNARLRRVASKYDVRFVDAFPKFLDQEGQLRQELTYDGIHLRAAGYSLLRDALRASPTGQCPD